MFRYNFQQYGNDELNRAIDAAHKAKVGLIAMKTQGSAVSFEPQWKKFEQTGKWNKYQAVMKAVWADERITAAVSDMDNLDKVRENVGAALDKTKLTQAETRGAVPLRRRHPLGHLRRLRPPVRRGPATAPVQIGPTLRYLMYHDVYGKSELAKELFRKLPAEARQIAERRLQPAPAPPAPTASTSPTG